MTLLERFWKVRVCEACNTIVGPGDKVPHPGGHGRTQTFYRCPACDRYHEYAPIYSRPLRRAWFWLFELLSGAVLERWRARWRLTWNLCPRCNDDAPAMDKCDVCEGRGAFRLREADGEISRDNKQALWQRFLNNHDRKRPRFSNSNEDRHGNRAGSIFWHGRGWIHLPFKLEFTVEWVFGRKSHYCGFELEILSGDCNDSLGFNFGLWKVFSFYLELERFFRWLPYSRRKKTREYGVKFHDGSMWVDIGAQPWESNSSDRWFEKTHCFHVSDWILGRSKYVEDPNPQVYLNVPFAMPERVYRGTVKLADDAWHRRFGKTVVARAHIEMNKGDAIPHPGKGENSWDCGEDATYSMTCPAKTLEEAIASMIESAMRSRRRHGGSVNWRPAVSVPEVELSEIRL